MALQDKAQWTFVTIQSPSHKRLKVTHENNVILGHFKVHYILTKKHFINIKYVIAQLYRLSSSLCHYSRSNNIVFLRQFCFTKCFYTSYLI